MTDISDLREGDEIEVVMRLKVRGAKRPVCVSKDEGIPFYLDQVFNIAERVTVIRPEIIPGQPYVDADGRLYVGRRNNRVTGVNADGTNFWYGEPSDRPLPAGLRAAKVVPQ